MILVETYCFLQFLLSWFVLKCRDKSMFRTFSSPLHQNSMLWRSKVVFDSRNTEEQEQGSVIKGRSAAILWFVSGILAKFVSKRDELFSFRNQMVEMMFLTCFSPTLDESPLFFSKKDYRVQINQCFSEGSKQCRCWGGLKRVTPLSKASGLATRDNYRFS